MSSWSILLQLLLLVVTCSHAVLVCSYPGSGYSIDIGNLKREATKLSIGPNQGAWWQLALVPWRDSAINRFFAAGPLTAAEMEALAAHSANSDSWNASKIKSIEQTDLTQALQRLSMARYRLNEFIVGTGKIEASMWTLLFKCVGTNCSEGYLVPIVIVPAAATAGRTSDDSPYVYATLWLPATRSMLVNAVPSFLLHVLSESNPLPIALLDPADSLSLELNVWDHGLTSCPSTAVANCRTLIDGAYGLLPRTACIRLSSAVDQTSFNLLVSVPATAANGSNTDYFTSVESFLSWIGVTNGLWALQPFEACSEEAVLVPSVDGGLVSDSFMMCYKASCKGIFRASMSCGSSEQGGILPLKSIVAYMKASPECTSTLYNVSCQFLATSERCVFAVFGNNGSTSMPMISPTSRWASTKGLNTKEDFENAHPITVSAEHAPCTVREPSLSFNVGSDVRGSVVLPRGILISARAYLAGYMAEHNIAFTTSRGPPTDMYTFIALIVSTALSVILAISGSFTSFLLREICKRRPLHLDNQHGKARQVAKVCFQIGCNVVLSMASFLPVLSVAMNEMEREKPFCTWDLGSSDLDARYDPTESDKLRVIYLFSGVSQYTSHFLATITVTVSATCFIVGGCAAWRCIQIFERYRLLKGYDVQTSGSDEGSWGELHRALRAIEMTAAEYLKITEEMRRLYATSCIEAAPPAAVSRRRLFLNRTGLSLRVRDAAAGAQITSPDASLDEADHRTPLFSTVPSA